ncbi:MAG: hypothetical protein FJZ38_24550 [Candidatus Rokubacteria bacterium]|nr:hypothetical protein [Candidatus Rokubacteria bacterium]
MLLHDLLAACAISGCVLAATYTILEQGLRTHAAGMARAEGQQAARAALARLSAELRNAGRGAKSTAPAIAVAEPARVVLVSDLDNDGTTTDRGERITWQLVGSILRRNAGAGAQPVANGVRAFELQYFDAAGRPTSDPPAIRAVEVALVTGVAAGESGLTRGTSTRITTRVRLRNR